MANLKEMTLAQLENRAKELKANDAVGEYIKVTNRIFTVKFTAKAKAEKTELIALRALAAAAKDATGTDAKQADGAENAQPSSQAGQ